MREWPLNSAMLTTTTHSKLREALDGTDTQVATCTIDRWTAKMKRIEGYITREILRRQERQFGRCQEVILVEYQKRRRRNHPRPRTEDELWPSPQPCCRRSSSSTIPPDLKASSQRLSSQARFSTKFIVFGLLGLGLLTSTVKGAPQIGTLQLALSVERTWGLVRAIIEQGRAKTPRGNDDGQPIGPWMENCQGVPNSAGVWRHARGPRPYQGPDDPPTSRAAPIGPRWRKTVVARNAFKGLCGGDSFWISVLVPSTSFE